MAFVEVPDRAAGYALAESDWDLWADNLNGATWNLLANTTVVGDFAVGSIDFTSIPQTWSHLMIVAYMRGATAASSVGVGLRFNGDDGTNYDYQWLTGSAATPAASEVFARAKTFLVGGAPAASAGADLFGSLRLVVPAYAGTTGHKAAVSRWSEKSSTSSAGIRAGRAAGFWRSTAAVTRLTLLPDTGDWDVGCRATLYGLP